MQQTLQPRDTWKRKIVNGLRRSPGLRGTLYLTAAAASLELVFRLNDHTQPYNIVIGHMKTAPLVVLLTGVGLYLQSERPIGVDRTTVRQSAMQTLRGVGIGVGAYLGWIGAATACGWVSLPRWGWTVTSVSNVLQSAAILGMGHLAVAWNEEQVFRGYGFDTLRQAIGGWGAAAILIPLFAIGHSFTLDLIKLQGFLITGAVLTLMRVQSGSIWLAVGYHWAWNFMQTGLFGPATAEPSIRPMVVDGPYTWVGKPGSPEPGLLNTLIQCAVGVGVGLLWLAKKRRGLRTHQ
jgi:membrane protease YdiL (CAAX protease family)